MPSKASRLPAIALFRFILRAAPSVFRVCVLQMNQWSLPNTDLCASLLIPAYLPQGIRRRRWMARPRRGRVSIAREGILQSRARPVFATAVGKPERICLSVQLLGWVHSSFCSTSFAAAVGRRLTVRQSCRDCNKHVQHPLCCFLLLSRHSAVSGGYHNSATGKCVSSASRVAVFVVLVVLEVLGVVPGCCACVG
jgi:hypothetical protein